MKLRFRYLQKEDGTISHLQAIAPVSIFEDKYTDSTIGDELLYSYLSGYKINEDKKGFTYSLKYRSKTIILIILLFLYQPPSYAGMDFSMLGTMSGPSYTQNLSAFQNRTIKRLKDIIQLAWSPNSVHKNIELIQKEMNELAIEAGKTKNDRLIALQTEIEDILKYKLTLIINKYDTQDKTYFDSIAEAIHKLNQFKVPESVGAMVYAGCEIIKKNEME